MLCSVPKRMHPMSLIWTLLLALTVVSVGACSSKKKPAKQQEKLSALHYFNQGNTAFQSMAYGDAVNNFRKAIELDPKRPEFHYNLGLSYYHIGNYEGSVEAFTASTKIDPKMADPYYNMALAYNHMSKSEEANRMYNKYQELIRGDSDKKSDKSKRGMKPPAAIADHLKQQNNAKAGAPAKHDVPPPRRRSNPAAQTGPDAQAQRPRNNQQNQQVQSRNQANVDPRRPAQQGQIRPPRQGQARPQ